MEKISERLDALVCDMDGVLYRGGNVVPGAPGALDRLRAAGLKVLFCTNNSRATVDDYVARLSGMGFAVEPDEIITSAVVTAEELRSRGAIGSTAYVVGGPGIRTAMVEAGYSLCEGEDGEAADIVVVGWDETFTWDKMRIAATAVRSGATFVATNGDATLPVEGALWPGAGSILASIERASGRTAEVMGKPNPPMLASLRRHLGGVDRVAMVGDRPDTDLEGARRLGWMTILVLSGVTSAAEARSLSPAPDLVVGSLADLS